MYRLSALYGRPTDAEAFDAYYRDVHLPIARRMQGLTVWTLTWITSQDGGDLSPIHLVADLYASDAAAMQRILESEEGQAAQADLANFATGGVTFISGDVEDVEL